MAKPLCSLPAAVHIRQPTAGDDHHREGQGVDAQGPLGGCDIGTEIAFDGDDDDADPDDIGADREGRKSERDERRYRFSFHMARSPALFLMQPSG